MKQALVFRSCSLHPSQTRLDPVQTITDFFMVLPIDRDIKMLMGINITTAIGSMRPKEDLCAQQRDPYGHIASNPKTTHTAPTDKIPPLRIDHKVLHLDSATYLIISTYSPRLSDQSSIKSFFPSTSNDTRDRIRGC
jgi:hypothetical protein